MNRLNIQIKGRTYTLLVHERERGEREISVIWCFQSILFRSINILSFNDSSVINNLIYWIINFKFLLVKRFEDRAKATRKDSIFFVLVKLV